MSEQMQMPKKESNNIVGNPFEYVQDIFPKALESLKESFQGIGSAFLEVIGLNNLKQGGSKSAQESFKGGSK